MPTRSYDRIKNFSTQIAVEKTIGEIEKMLSKHGATDILKQYDDKGRPRSLAFRINTASGSMPICLPVRIENVQNVFAFQAHEKKLQKKYWKGEWAEEQAFRTGWRTIKDWLDAQLSLIQIEMVKIEEIFLPYVNVGPDRTLFQALEEQGFENLKMLGDGKKDG